MIPSAVAAEVAEALGDFLRTGFQPANAELAGVLDGFLETPENLLKGPYLSLSLPFRQAAEGGEPFPEIPLGFVPYRHQRTAMDRLRADSGRSTVIATGTGSGKTECFLWPILDHCRREAGKPGIKAIVIYPMNALAADQAGRIARTIRRNPALRGRISAGLFIGQARRRPQETAMSETRVIGDRRTLLEQPPDILLTNFRMLDYLLVRPSDQRLWRRNAPGALRYLVVDELHTFDGAQGTDLACLVRRLRARLGAGEGLICAGTSATLGGEGREPELLEHVRRVFHAPFEADAIVGESRQSIDEFLGGALITRILLPQANLRRLADPGRHRTSGGYLRALHRLFFGEEIPEDRGSDRWRVELGDRLRGHSAFVNLLRVMDGGPKTLAEAAARLRPTLPVANDREALLVVSGLAALIAAARRRGAEGAAVRPFLRVGLHLWVRELRRMVCGIRPREAALAGPEGEAANGRPKPQYSLRHSDDLAPEETALHLPLIQCRECRLTGWAGAERRADRKIETDLRVFYNRFFRGDPDVALLFPGAPPAGVRGGEVTVCASCRRLRRGHHEGACGDCGFERLVPLFRPDSTKAVREEGRVRRQLSRDCPLCGAKEALIIFGARAATLLSAALGQAFGSRHNDDRKVIAFSDNVQDAAHRAGFIGARTWTTGLRAALAQTIHASEGISLAELAGTSAGDPGRVVRWWSDRSVNPEAFDPERFVAEFLAPDRHWLRDFIALQREGRLPASSDLPELVAERLRWETLAELGYKSTIGRTLERTRVAAVGVDRQRLEGAVASLHDRLREEFGSLRNMRNETVRALLLGILCRMRMRGAAWSATNEEFLRRGARLWWLNRKLALQEFGKRSARPVFPSDGKTEEGLEPLVGRRRRRSWYRSWTEKMLRQPPLSLALADAPRVLAEAVGELAAAGLVRRVPLREADSWALDPAHFRVTPRVAEMRSARSGRSLAVAEDETDLWRGLPCFDLASNETWTDAARAPRTWFGELYRRTALRRVVAAEHTALLTRDRRERLQRRFAAPDPHPWEPNLLSATPTLELGIDIGDVSSVVLCSVPPAPENHVQRSGRAGRRDGNAFTLTLAAASPHDLHFYAEPLDMLAGQVNPPGVFLNASAVLERQLTAFCFDRWSASGVGEEAVPPRIRAVLDAVETRNADRFPFPFLAFVQREGEALLEAFFSAFAPDLEDRSKDYLAGFLLGEAGEDAPLQVRLFERLDERVRERRSLRNGIRTLRRWVRKLGNGPQDEATKAEIGELDRERKGLGSVLRTLNGQHTFNFLTDSGFLPNYAFPEEGITLKSVIYRTRERRAGEGSADGGHEHETFEYVRPAASALSEFAPENPFYAGARRVSMNRVDLQVSEIEDWRLCRQCPFAESVEAKDPHRTCPRCGDAMWADAGQLRKLLRLRLVHAFEPDRRSRILDQREEREPVFYTRELVADIAPEKVERAFAVTRPEAAFGFEYVSSATFRDLNFGRLDEGGQPTTFAGRKRGRPGFRVCGQCGSVQGRKEDPPEHTRTCRLHGKPAKESGEAVVECLYLYREFRSEALRMLLPGGGGDRSDPRTVSFVAALELGLRRRFRGRIEHLRVLPAEYPAADGLRRGCLVLYDTVPGGTGYLKELMTAPDQLAAVFRAAREALRTCPCAADPERDGCHRCLFAYRRSRELARTSCTAAVEMLDSLLEHASALEEVEELGRVKPRGPLQSELEERFVEALRRVSIGGEPARVRRDLVGGRPGYVLQAGERTWYLEPQVEFGRSEGVAVPSRADFRIRPARSDPGQPPLAVFLDGFAWHRETTAADSAKRMALVRAGYRVWSLTWQDLEEAFDGSAEAPDLLAAPAGAHGMAPLQRVLDRRWGTGPLRAGRGASSLALLRRWLADPDADRWKRAVFTRLFQQFERERMRSPAFRRAFAAAAAGTLPGVVRDRLAGCGEDSVVAGRGRWAGGDGPVEFFLAMPLSAVRRGEPDAMTAVVHLRDDEASRQTKGYRQLWNGALRAFNLLQFLPGGFWTTRLGVQGERYPEFAPPCETAPADGGEPWEEALEMADREIRPLLRELAERGAPAPEIGFERTGRDGAVVAEAEAAWPSRRVAVLLPDQRRGSGGFRKAGWTVVVSPGADAAAAAAAALALSARGETSATSDALVGLAERGRPVGAAGNAGLRNAVATRDPAGNNRPTRAAPRPAGASR